MTILHPRRLATCFNRLGVLVLLLACLPAMTVGAQQRAGNDDLFTARDVPVDETAATAAAAREIAIREGQRQALARVLQRLTPREEHSRLPQPSDADIAGMVANIQVENEKTSATRYLSKLTVSFQKDAIRDLLRRAAIPFSETRAPLTLVLPVLHEGNEFRLFDETSPWWLAWRQLQLLPNALLPLILPLGDIEDITSLSPEQALAGDAAALEAVRQRHGAEGVLVALATPRRAAGGEGIAAMDVSLRRYPPGGGDPAIDSFTVGGGEDAQAVMTATAGEAVARLNEAWKQETLLRLGGEGSLEARVPLSGLEDWVTLRERLTRNPSVRRVEVKAMSRREALITLHYLGQPEQLAESLAQDDATLEAGSGLWVLRLTDRGAGAANAIRAPE